MAARFIYLNRTCWNGLYRVNKIGQFNVPIGTKTEVINDDDNFWLIAERLRHCQLLWSDFENLINLAGLNDLIYVDPPYSINQNNNGFTKYNE